MADHLPKGDPGVEGKRVKGDKSPAIYLVLDLTLRHITSPEVYQALFADAPFETIPQGFIDAYPKGPDLDQRTPLIKGFDAPVYLVDQDKKRWITSPPVFARYGFAASKITPIGSIVSLVASGPDIK